jgi:capsular polysaccharide biosynthesis protein
MNDEALDLPKSARILRRNVTTVALAAALGLLAGAAFALAKPPLRASTAIVLLQPAVNGVGPQPARYLATQLVVATSYPVLAGADRALHPQVPVATLHGRVAVTSPSADLIAFTAQAPTDAEAAGIANAVARSYIAQVGSSGGSGALLLQRAAGAAATSLATRFVVDAGVGAALGALAGSLFVLATRRGRRRLRERDEIASATGVPVLASVPVCHPSDAAGWAKLLDGYQPDAVQAWSMQRTLRQLGVTDGRAGPDARLALLSLSSDHRALALGPQLATFAASLGIPTTLVLGQGEDAPVTAALRAACAAHPGLPRDPGQPGDPGRPGDLHVHMGADVSQPSGTPLTVIVDVLDPRTLRAAGRAAASATVLSVSAGAATAEDLARMAVSAALSGGQIAGILLADPDPADETTGYLPQLAAPEPLTRPSAR